MSPSLFESFYQSPFQHPILLWVVNLLGTVLALRLLGRVPPPRSSKLRTFVLIWALVSALDAWLSADQVFGIGVLPAPFSSIIPFLFVWAGDYRIFLALDGMVPKLRALLASLVVPGLAGVFLLGKSPRILFLSYELMFLAWLILYSKLTGPHRSLLARPIRNLALMFYTLWAIADVLILILPSPWNDLGFGVRVIPNALYYGAFGWVCARFGGSAGLSVNPPTR
jgi:hypothetical protein